MNNRQIIRSTIDSDIFHIAYEWQSKSGGIRVTRLACTIHMDDIAGVFGEEVAEPAIYLAKGEELYF